MKIKYFTKLTTGIVLFSNLLLPIASANAETTEHKIDESKVKEILKTDSSIPNPSTISSKEVSASVGEDEKEYSSLQSETSQMDKTNENIDSRDESAEHDEGNVSLIEESVTTESSIENQSNEKKTVTENNNTLFQNLLVNSWNQYGWYFNKISGMNYRFLTEYSGDPEHIKIPSRIGGYNVLVDLSDGLARYGIDKTKVKSITFVDEGSTNNNTIAGIVKQLAGYVDLLSDPHGSVIGNATPINGNKIDFSGFTNLETVDFSGFSFSSPDDSYNATQGYWDFREMFAGDTKLKSVNFNSKHGYSYSWNEILRMRNTFKDCVSLEQVDFSSLAGNSRPTIDFETGTFSNTPMLKEVNFNGNGSSLNFSKSALFTNGGTIFDTTSIKRKNLKVLVPKGNEITGISNEEWAKYGVDPIGAGVTLNTSAGSFSNGQMTKTYMYNVVNPSSSDLPVEASFEQPINLEEGKVFFGWNKTGSQNSFGLTFSTYSANIVESEWTWTKNSDNTVTLNSYIGKSTDIVVPNEIAGMPTQINLASGIDARGLGDEGWTKATSITFSNANGKKVKLLGNKIKFDKWASLKFFDGRGLDTTGVKDLNSLFWADTLLETVDLTGWDMSLVENTAYMFACYEGTMKLSSIKGLENANFGNVRSMRTMFQNTRNLKKIPLDTWTVRKVEDMSFMFVGSGIKTANLAPWNIYTVEAMKNMFWGSDVENVYFGKAGAVWRVKDMTNMFAYTKSLKFVDTSVWNVDNLALTTGMFKYSGIEKIDLSTWNPIQTGIDMSSMFENTSSLRQVDMRGFTNLDSQITTTLLGIKQKSDPIMLITGDYEGNKGFIAHDFQKESGRISYSMPNIKTSNKGLTLPNGQLSQPYLTTIPVVPSTLEKTRFDNWLAQNTPKSQVIDNKYYYVKDVTSSKGTSTVSSVLDLLDTTYTVNIVESDWEFKYDSSDNSYELIQYLGINPDIVVPNEIDGKPTKIDLSSGIKTPNLGDPKTTVTSITFDSSDGKKSQLKGDSISFSDYSVLTSFDGHGLDTSGLKSLNRIFYWCTSLERVDLQGWNTSGVDDMQYLFNHDHKLINILGLNTWDVSKVKNFYGAFNECHSLQSLDLSNWVTSSATNMEIMFNKTFKLTSLNVSQFDTSHVTTFKWMFAKTAIENLDLNHFDISLVTNMHGMFSDSNKLSEVNISQWNPIQTGINMSNMFENTSSLRQVDMRGFTNLDSQNTTLILGVKQSATPIMLITGDSPGNSRFISFDFQKESGRIPYEKPVLHANKGIFKTSGETKHYITKCAIPYTDLSMEHFNQWLKDNTPERKAYDFIGWNINGNTAPTSVLDLLETTYIAKWKRKDTVNSSIDNTLKTHTSDLEISYAPTSFEFDKPKVLGSTGENYIPLKHQESFNLGVRDTSNQAARSWSVSAQLKWLGKNVPGARLQLYNQTGEIKLNVNDGTTSFNPVTDLVETSGEVLGKKMAQITVAQNPIVWSATGERNGIYDYDLGKVNLRIPEIGDVESGIYTGVVEWNLMNVPVTNPDETSAVSQQSINTAKKIVSDIKNNL